MNVSPLPFLLAGEWKKSADLLQVFSPYDNRLVGEVCRASKDDVNAAIGAAHDSCEAMKSLASYQRSSICRDVSSRIHQHEETLALLMAAELGKAIKDCRVEVARAAFVFQVAAEEAGRIDADLLSLDWSAGNEGRFGLVRRFPKGVVAGITPFNFPLNLVAHKIAPAIASGCPIIIKPASKTPLIALKLAEMISATALPKGALSVLPASAKSAELLLTDPRIRVVSFTGSGEVGWQIKKTAWDKEVVLELGGNAGVIVADDADLSWAATRLLFGSFGSAGQSCISVQRIFAQRSIYDSLTQKLASAAKQLKVGDPTDPSTDIGALVDSAAVERTMDWISQAVRQGATLLTGGTATGNQITPTILTNTRREMAVCSKEVFAPVVTIEPYDSFAEAIARVNDSDYGLQAGVFTNRMNDILTAYNRLECGGVIINDVPTWRVDQMPYGGVKQSGLGREGIRYAIESMTEPKLLAIKSN